MATIEDVLDQVDGLRRDAARRVQERFGSVSELAEASTEQLTAITGIGQVMADRIRAVAQGTATGLPDAAKDSAARAAASADKAIDSTAEAARKAVDDLESRARTNVHRLHARSDQAVDESRGIIGTVWHVATTPARIVLDKIRQHR